MAWTLSGSGFGFAALEAVAGGEAEWVATLVRQRGPTDVLSELLSGGVGAALVASATAHFAPEFGRAWMGSAFPHRSHAHFDGIQFDQLVEAISAISSKEFITAISELVDDLASSSSQIAVLRKFSDLDVASALAGRLSEGRTWFRLAAAVHDAGLTHELLDAAEVDEPSMHDWSVRSFMCRLVAMLKTANDNQISDVIAAIEEMPHGVVAEFIQISTVEDIGFTLADDQADTLRRRVIDEFEANHTDRGYWEANRTLISQVLRHHATYVNPEATAALIEPVLAADHDLCVELLTWYAAQDINTGHFTFMVGYGPPLPPWIPTEPIVAAVTTTYPELRGLNEFQARTLPTADQRLAATFLVASGL